MPYSRDESLGHACRCLLESSPPVEFRPKKLRLSRMAEMNVKSDTGIERERLESYRQNPLRIEPDTHVVHQHRGGGAQWFFDTHQQIHIRRLHRSTILVEALFLLSHNPLIASDSTYSRRRHGAPVRGTAASRFRLEVPVT